MKPEEITRPVLFQVTYFWNRLMGSGMMASHWIESPEIIDELGNLLEDVHERKFFDGYRVGSRWDAHSKFVPTTDFGGNFYVDVNVNFDPQDRGGERYEQAENAARIFIKTTRNFLQFCDNGNFDPKQLADDYDRLNTLLQEAYGLVKENKRKDGKLKYNEAIEYIAERAGLKPDEVRTAMNRLNMPAFLLDNHALEAVIGTEVTKSRSMKALEEMEKEYNFFENPYVREEFDVRGHFTHVIDDELLSYDGDKGIVQSLNSLPRSKKPIVVARILHELRSGNDSVTNAYRKNVYFKPK